MKHSFWCTKKQHGLKEQRKHRKDATKKVPIRLGNFGVIPDVRIRLKHAEARQAEDGGDVAAYKHK